jgi:protein-disulfide isomerase
MPQWRPQPRYLPVCQLLAQDLAGPGNSKNGAGAASGTADDEEEWWSFDHSSASWSSTTPQSKDHWLGVVGTAGWEGVPLVPVARSETVPHIEAAKVNLRRKRQDGTTPAYRLSAPICATWLACLQVALIAIATLLVSAGGFVSFRYVAQRSRAHLALARPAQLGSESNPIGLDNAKPQKAAAEIPAVSDVIAESLTWQPPVATGNPSPIDRKAALEVATGDHALGSQRAPITLMLFGDLHCRYTLQSLRLLSRRVQEQPNEYRLVWRQRPLDVHPEAFATATTAERLALQYGEISFWRFVRAVSRLKGSASTSDVDTIAHALQIGSAKMSDAAAVSKAAGRLERDRVIGLTYSIHATPTLFVNGLRFEGRMANQLLDEVIEEESDAVQALRDDSVPQAQIYTIRVDENLLDLVRE